MTDPGDPASVHWHLDGPLAEVRLNRPERLNALDEAMVATFHGVLDEVASAPARALLLTAEGRAFSAGRDLQGADPGHEDPAAILRETFNPLLARLHDLPLPTFAAVQGACLGVGLGLALACDVVVAADNARIGSPFARIGAVLDSGAHRHLVDRVGAHRTLELVYTGRLLDGQEAAAMGIVNRSVSAESLEAHVREMAVAVADGPTAAFLESKALVRRMGREPLDLDAVLAAEAEAQGRAGATGDYAEGITAFQEKRAPRFTGS